jgi:hypothetical protein
VSLKAFHVFFVVVSTLLSLFCGVWGVLAYTHTGSGGYLAFGIGSFVAAVALVVYGFWFLRKLKNVSA